MIDGNIEVYSVMRLKKIQYILEKNHFYKVIYSNRE